MKVSYKKIIQDLEFMNSIARKVIGARRSLNDPNYYPEVL